MLQQLKLLSKIELMQKSINPEFDYLSDIGILKSFDLPLTTQLNDLHEGTLPYRLLKDRKNRPSADLWKKCLLIAKSQKASYPPTFAAEIYLDVLMKNEEEEESPDFEKQIVEDKQYPPRDDTRPEDAMPNITGGMADVQGGDFKSLDSEKGLKDCDK